MTDTNNSAIPRTCKAGVVHNEGPNFTLTVEDVPVPEPGSLQIYTKLEKPSNVDNHPRSRRCPHQTEHHRYLLLRHTLHARRSPHPTHV